MSHSVLDDDYLLHDWTGIVPTCRVFGTDNCARWSSVPRSDVLMMQDAADRKRHIATMLKHAKVYNSHALFTYRAPQHPRTATATTNERLSVSLIFPKRYCPRKAVLVKQTLTASNPLRLSIPAALSLEAPIQLSTVPAHEVVASYPSPLRVRDAST